MSGHTPEPWTLLHFADETSTCACSYIFSSEQSGFGAVATVQFGGEDEPYETAKANAILIAAAPDLLEALESMVSASKMGSPAYMNSCRRDAEIAIARAKGEL